MMQIAKEVIQNNKAILAQEIGASIVFVAFCLSCFFIMFGV